MMTTLRKSCAIAAMRDDSTPLLIQEMFSERVADAPVTVSDDFRMLLLTGGRERTEAEYRTLLELSDLQLTVDITFEPTRIHSGRKPNWVIIESKLLGKER